MNELTNRSPEEWELDRVGCVAGDVGTEPRVVAVPSRQRAAVERAMTLTLATDWAQRYTDPWYPFR